MAITNIERIQQMSVDDFTDWFVHQLWPELNDKKSNDYIVRWHAVRNYLLDKEEDTQ